MEDVGSKIEIAMSRRGNYFRLRHPFSIGVSSTNAASGCVVLTDRLTAQTDHFNRKTDHRSAQTERSRIEDSMNYPVNGQLVGVYR